MIAQPGCRASTLLVLVQKISRDIIDIYIYLFIYINFVYQIEKSVKMANYSRNAAQLHAKYDIRETLGR